MAEVYIYFFEGRTMDQKRGMVRDVTEAVARNLEGAAESVIVQLIESPRHAKAKGGVLYSDMEAPPKKT
jgi:4-oxalocrotonate tautomerase